MVCPNCQKSQTVTEQQYGALYTCSSCQAVYFISFEGQPEYSEINPEDFNPEQNEAIDLNPVGQTGALSQNSIPQMMPPPLENEIGSLEPLVSNSQMLEMPADDFAMPPPLETHESLNESPFEIQNNMSGLSLDALQSGSAMSEDTLPAVAVKAKQVPLNNTAPRQTQNQNKPQSNSFASIAQEISDFANTDSQLAGLNYDLVITGIDTVETKNLFKEAIEDSKFAWDAFEIMKSLKNGRVEILKLSPAKAFLLAKRIQFLDIEKSWKQNVLS